MNILIVEDEKRLADALSHILVENKYMVDVVYDGADGLAYGESGIYDCIILDVMLPGINGIEIATHLRNNNIQTPIIMLTAKDSLGDKIAGLDSGADDYMTKPFEPDELLARIRALTRRKGTYIPNEIKYGDIVFSISTSEIRKNAKSIRLNFKECEILKLLVFKPNILLSKEEIIMKVWGYDSDAGDSNVEAYMSFLRRKLSFIESNIEIISIKKMGYRLGDTKCSEG
jgi:DNA-binding response OmpR family regulator